MKPYKLLVFGLLFLSYISYSRGGVDEDDYDYDEYYEEEDMWCESDTLHKCLPNNRGYNVYKCNETKKGWDFIRVHKCPENKPGCQCGMVDPYSNDWLCECYNPRGKPDFPATGILRWNGTFVFNDYGYQRETRTSYVPGEVHMDSRGRYLLKKTAVSERGSKTTVEFEIILPSSIKGYYVKHTGDTSSKNCKTTETTSAGSLRSIWQDHDSSQYYQLTKETSHPEKRDIYIQTWTGESIGEIEWVNWKFIVEFDAKKDVAIPLKLNREQDSDWNGADTSMNLVYTYQPSEKDEETFKLEDYCTFG